MKQNKALLSAGIGLVLAGTVFATTVQAEEKKNVLEIEGVGKMVTRLTAPKGHPLDEIISGWEFRSVDTQELEKDDFNNSGFLWVEKGEELWSKVEGEAGKSCASCHDDASKTMKGVRAQMPKWNAATNQPWTLEQHINGCRTGRMKAKAWKWESDNMLSMTSYIGNQSRGMPVNVNISTGDMKSWWERGKKIYYTRYGQLDMACANCHEDNYGNYIRADRLSQGQINGFPTYRLKWQKVGSIHRRFKGCMDQVRAKPYKRGSPEFVALEVYVATRGTGLSVESPAVRN